MSPSSALALELDLEPFCGPFDLLLALVLRDVVDLGEVPVADVCLLYLAQIDEEGELDLESASEFLVLVSALLELKIRLLLTPDEVDDMPDAEEAAEELAARLAEYARAQAAAAWLQDRLAAVGLRVFRDGPPALRPPAAAALSAAVAAACGAGAGAGADAGADEGADVGAGAPPLVLSFAFRCARTISASSAVTARFSADFTDARGAAFSVADDLHLQFAAK